jgi:hypothetical protein
MADISNVKMGVCSVSLDGTDLGHTKGGVTVEYEPVIQDITVDKYGETPSEKVLTGEHLRATVPLAESTIANIGNAIPAGTTTDSKITLGGQVGDRLLALAGELVLHPIANDSDDLSEDVVIYKAVAVETVELPFMVDEERVVEVTFEGMIDESRSDGDMLGLIGDSTA